MTTTRSTALRAAGITAAALSLALGTAACSSSTDGAEAPATTTEAAADGTTAPSDAADTTDLQQILPPQEVFGEGFVLTPVSAEQLGATLGQVRDAAKEQRVDPADCAPTLDLTAGLDPADTAMVAAGNQDQQTKIGVIVTDAEGTLDNVRNGVADCGKITVTTGDAFSTLTTTEFAPQGATGDEVFGITRVQEMGDKGQVTTVLASEVVDGVTIRVMINQPSLQALTPDVMDHFTGQASQILNDTAARVSGE